MKSTDKGSAEKSLPLETQNLLYTYFDAFTNLYGIVPLYRALRIIQKQNPELALTEDQFLAFVGQVENEEHFYAIIGEDEAYADAPKTMPMKRDLVREYLYALNEGRLDDYCELKEDQADKPFFVPEKEELLKYADDGYFKETRESAALRNYLKDTMKMKRTDEIMEEFSWMIRLGIDDVDTAVATLQDFGKNPPFANQKQALEFVNLYVSMSNNTRMHCNRGFTPRELMMRMGSSPKPVSFGRETKEAMDNVPFPSPVSLTGKPKPGRNDPCPCGSGKKYKHCCGK